MAPLTLKLFMRGSDGPDTSGVADSILPRGRQASMCRRRNQGLAQERAFLAWSWRTWAWPRLKVQRCGTGARPRGLGLGEEKEGARTHGILLQRGGKQRELKKNSPDSACED